MSAARLQADIVHWNCESIEDDLLDRCCELFSEHYGVWSQSGARPGEPILISPLRLHENYLFNASTCSLITAHVLTEAKNQLIGYALLCRFPYAAGHAIWVTQLVVHTDMRRQGIATAILSKAWRGETEGCAWGIITSHPQVVRTLERVTQRMCDPLDIAKHATELVRASGIPDFQHCPLSVDCNQSVMHTNFYLDHLHTDELLCKEKDWRLGTLQEGDEFFAFTFK